MRDIHRRNVLPMSVGIEVPVHCYKGGGYITWQSEMLKCVSASQKWFELNKRNVAARFLRRSLMTSDIGNIRNNSEVLVTK